MSEVYQHGPRLPVEKPWSEVIKRSRWAMHQAGFVYPKIRYYFHAGITYTDVMGEKRAVDGYYQSNEKSSTIRVDGTKPVTDTILHELCHAILAPIENQLADHHSPVFWAVLGLLNKQYEEEGGPYPDV